VTTAKNFCIWKRRRQQICISRTDYETDNATTLPYLPLVYHISLSQARLWRRKVLCSHLGIIRSHKTL